MGIFRRKGGATGAKGKRPPKWATAEGLRQLAEGMAASARSQLGLGLDFSPESLSRWDEALDAYFDPETRRSPVTVVDTGAYAGEVVIRNLGGRWRPAEDPLECAIVDLDGDVAEVYPVSRALKRTEEGRGSSLTTWYAAIERHVHGGR